MQLATMCAPFLEKVPDAAHRARVLEILEWVATTFPELEPVYKWNQPMFTMDGTFIIGFSVASKHVSFSAEKFTMDLFRERFEAAGLTPTKMLAHIDWDAPVPTDILRDVIAFNMDSKRGTRTFWRHE